MNDCTIIIPVFNAFRDAEACLESVIQNLPEWADVLVIDDCSTEGDFRESIPLRLRSHSSIRFLRNPINLGFVGSCNRGMLLHSRGDVVLLNSDTVVTPRWLEKLREAARSRGDVGTVTPFTNNGTIASVPRFLENNILPSGVTPEAFGEIIERLSSRTYPVLPTCVGFCVYITRTLLDRAGGFDPAFGKGYGEENDLSLRAVQHRLVNILDDATFILHKGNMSFADMRESLSRENSRTLNARYPSYESDVATFCAMNPLENAHNRIWNTIQSSSSRAKSRMVLHVLHNGPFVARRHALGGTELHVQSLIRNESRSAHFSLTPAFDRLVLTAHTEFGDRNIPLPMNSDLSQLLSTEYFDLIHVHHTLGFDLRKLAAALKSHGNYVVSVHDYWLVCNRIFLSTLDGKVCDGTSCANCDGRDREEKRSLGGSLLSDAAKVVIFSRSTEEILKRTVGLEAVTEQVPHGISLETERRTGDGSANPDDPVIRILFAGTLVPHKGLSLIRELSAVHEVSPPDGSRQIEWFFVGDSSGEHLPGVRMAGRYDATNLQRIIDGINPHLSVLVPQCQETYSMTLDELLWCGVPVIVSPFGALPERVTGWGVGAVAENRVEGVLEVISSMIADAARYRRIRKAVSSAPLITIREEVSRYSRLYDELVPVRAGSSDALMSFLQPGT